MTDSKKSGNGGQDAGSSKHSSEQEKVTKAKQQKTGPENKDQTTPKNVTRFMSRVRGTVEKGVAALKTGTQKITQFTGGAAKLAKLKLEIHNLQSELDNLYLEAGRKLWQMHKEKKLGEAKNAFAGQFEKYQELKQQIAAKEQEAGGISLLE